MAVRFSRFRFAATATMSFIVGVYFASAMDWTRWSWAQKAPGGSQIAVRGPMADGASFADIAERVTPAVVAVNTTRLARPMLNRRRGQGQVPPGMEEFLQQFGGQQPRTERGEGSGFILTPDGYIVTNNHVVADADQVQIVMSDGRSFKAKVVGMDSTTVVAVVKIDAKGLPTLPVGNDETTRIGDWVLAVGNPLGLDFTVTAGIISAKGRGRELQQQQQQQPGGSFSISDFIQTDAAINPGNSGGPLVNLRGEVIGLNSAIISQTGTYSGYGFAIPVSLVKSVADALIKDGRIRLAVMGVQVTAIDPEDAGINGLSKVAGVKVGGFNPPDGGPAKAAGIEVGDVIVAIDGRAVDRVSALQRIVRTHRVGDQVKVDLVRFGTKKSVTVKLVEAEALAKVADASSPSPVNGAKPVSGKLGVTLEPITPEIAKQLGLKSESGVRVGEVSETGPAKDKLVPGQDVILEVLYPTPKKTIKSVSDLQAVLSGLKAGDYVSLLVYLGGPNGGNRVVNLRLGE